MHPSTGIETSKHQSKDRQQWRLGRSCIKSKIQSKTHNWLFSTNCCSSHRLTAYNWYTVICCLRSHNCSTLNYGLVHTKDSHATAWTIVLLYNDRALGSRVAAEKWIRVTRPCFYQTSDTFTVLASSNLQLRDYTRWPILHVLLVAARLCNGQVTCYIKSYHYVQGRDTLTGVRHMLTLLC